MRLIDELEKAASRAHRAASEAHAHRTAHETSDAVAEEKAREDLAHEAKLNATTELDAARRAVRKDI